MASDPNLRAGDADRDATIATLREAYAQGRLTQGEFDHRLDEAHSAVTFGDLAAITADLPLPARVESSAVAPTHSRRSRDMRAAWASWAGVSLLMVVIWGATWMTSGGSAPYFWPVWVIGPWGAAMLIPTLSRRFGGDDS